MEDLSRFLESYYCAVTIDLSDKKWHTKAKIPSVPGWYFIQTNMPFERLCAQDIWQATYVTKKKQEIKPVRNYNLSQRAQRFGPDLSNCWNIKEVYSGMSSNLMSRAREHTFADPGTSGLALSRYPEARDYKWLFGYLTLERFLPNPSCQHMLLNLGEQIWRSKNGWPLLCAE